MNTSKVVAVVVAVVVVLGGAWWYMGGALPGEGGADLGTYAYQCQGGEQFTMTPASDTSSITLVAGANAPFSGTVMLAHTSSTAGQRFEGSGVVFVGAGEDVTLIVNDKQYICDPVPSQDMAPFNWGDAGEGAGSTQPSATLVVSESIVGKWQSIDDSTFVREFNSSGQVVDSTDGKPGPTGTWKVFTKIDAPAGLSLTLDSNSVYIQLTWAGVEEGSDMVLNFKLAKLTPEELQLVYLDRGGVLSFKAVQ